MTKRKTKYTSLIIILLVAASIGAILWMRSYVFSHFPDQLNEKIQSLKVSGFNIRYDSMSVDWRSNIVEIHGLLIEKNPYDTTCVYAEFITVDKVSAEGFRLFTLIFSNVLDFEEVHLESPRMLMRHNSLLRLDSTIQRENEFTLRTDNVYVKDAEFEYTDDSTHCEPITSIKGDMAIEDLKLDFRIEKPFAYTATTLVLDSTEVKFPKEFYTFVIQQARLDLVNETLRVDSVKIIADVGKLEFGRKRGYEVDRFEGSIPFLKAENFTFSFPNAIVKAGVAELQFYLKIFRDKRLPFRRVIKPLPIDAVRALPFELVIDSLKIIKSYAQYEEFGEEATDPGGVYFDDLYAVLSNISSTAMRGNLQLTAQAELMGQGDLSMAVTFPLARNTRSTLVGSLQNFDISRINPMIKPAANIEIESGKMKKLSFNFTFNSVRSDGEIELNYENLKLITYKNEDKDNDDKLDKDNFKSFMMNTFVFRKNMNEKVPEDKRTGTVMFLRDENRSVFNFWVKSLLSGIKSAYKLDKAAEKEIERELKKEERLSKRLERKLKKSEKKKDRG